MTSRFDPPDTPDDDPPDWCERPLCLRCEAAECRPHSDFCSAYCEANYDGPNDDPDGAWSGGVADNH